VIITKKNDEKFRSNSFIIPFTDQLKVDIELPDEIKPIVNLAIREGLFTGELEEIYLMSALTSNTLTNIILVGLGNDKKINNRKINISFAKAFKKCKSLEPSDITVLLDNASTITHIRDVCRKICELPTLAYYNFDAYKSSVIKTTTENIKIVCSLDGFDEILKEAAICTKGTILARDLTNQRSMYMTPTQLAKEAKIVADESNIEITILEEKEIKKLKMEAFLAVGKGSKETPKLIVMKYLGGDLNQERIGLIGKGITFDSGGYSLKQPNSMVNMSNDMGGAAAVIGAMGSIAKMKLKVNVIGIIAACENKVSAESYVPGDIITSMSGKTIEVLNTDAEGRLTLADAITYAINECKVDKLIDIATLTGAARGAVGNKTAAVISNDDDFFNVFCNASKVSCEKVWRLDADDELKTAILSNFADLRNSSSKKSAVGGGTIVAGLFIKEFIEDKPWIHIDMAPVNWTSDGNSFGPAGATGYGANLLYNTIKLIQKQ
jgi:leucyl aminopeptidase